MTKIDLRKKPAPAPFPTAPAAAAAILPGPNRMPLPQGHMIPATLTPAERAKMAELGVKEGTVIPGNFAEIVAAAEQDAVRENAAALPPASLDTPPLQLPPTVAVSSLPTAKQAEIARGLQEAAEAHRQQTTLAASALDPSVKAAVAAGIAAGAQTPSDMPVIDDRNAEFYGDTGEPKPVPASRMQQPVEHAHTETDDLRPQFCSHCGWDQAVTDPIVVTEDDKRSFLAAVLGGVHWRKAFTLMAGRMAVVVRNLSTEEIDLCYRQAYLEVERGVLKSSKEFAELVNRYRMVLQLVSLNAATGMTWTLPERLTDWDVDCENGNTKLFEITKYVQTNVLPNETIHRLVAGKVADFNRMETKLEANVENADFWNGTALQA